MPKMLPIGVSVVGSILMSLFGAVIAQAQLLTYSAHDKNLVLPTDSGDILAGPPSDPVNSIASFVACINSKLLGSTDVSKTVSECIPDGCFMTVTNNPSSAQGACQCNCKLPRIILSCPGPMDDLRFRPSYVLCPFAHNKKGTSSPPITTEANSNLRIEVGEDTQKVTFTDGNRVGTGKMMMADVPNTDYGDLFEISGSADPAAVVSTSGNDKNCTSCHGGAGMVGEGKEAVLLSLPFNPFQTAIKPLVVSSDEPGFVTGNPKTSLAPFCDCIKNRENLKSLGPMQPQILALCQALSTYQTTRSASKSDAPGEMYTDVSCSGTFVQGADTSQLEADFRGMSAPTGGVLDFANIGSELNAVNQGTGTQINQVSFSAVQVTQSGSSLATVGEGEATVNGVTTNINFSCLQTDGIVTFDVTNRDTGEWLAGGTGVSGKSSTQLTFRSSE
jgi:hypothetical protein